MLLILLFFIRTNLIRTTSLNLIKNKKKLRTLWGWEVQIEITMINFLLKIYLQKNDLNTEKVIDVTRCSIRIYNFILLIKSNIEIFRIPDILN